jgi:hypothetical protein
MRRREISLNVLIDLIDDPDFRVFERVRNELLEFGAEILPALEECLCDGNISPDGFDRVGDIIKEIHLQQVKTDFETWLNSSEKDLAEGAYLVSHFQFPELTRVDFHRIINAIKKDIWLEINSKQTAFETIKTFNRMFFYFHEFKRIRNDQPTPFDLYLKSVIDTGEGDPFALGLLYSIIAQSLDLPVYKIIQPNGNSILAFMDENQTLSHLNLTRECNGILFYINTESHGAIIDSLSLQEKLAKLGIKSRRAFLEPSPNTVIIKSYLQKLIDSCKNSNHSQKARELQELLRLF